MTPTMTMLLIGLAVGVGVAWVMGSEGGEKILFVALAFGLGLMMARAGVL